MLGEGCVYSCVRKDMILDYQQLVKDYWENLNSQLRGFTAGADFLDTWVPDENHIRSIESLFESAQLHGIDSLKVKIQKAVVDEVGQNQLSAVLDEFGDNEITDDGSTFVFSVEFKNK